MKFEDVYGRVWRFKDVGGVVSEVRGRRFVVIARKFDDENDNILIRIEGLPGPVREDGLWSSTLNHWDAGEVEEVTG